jgi:hypothetical protein
MKLVRILAALVCAGCALFLPYCLFATLTGAQPINPQIVDSRMDKFFWIIMIAGGAVAYGCGSVGLFIGRSVKNSPYFLKIFIVCGLAFACGIYYHMIFQSPW